jgi:hypothetical protein
VEADAVERDDLQRRRLDRRAIRIDIRERVANPNFDRAKIRLLVSSSPQEQAQAFIPVPVV